MVDLADEAVAYGVLRAVLHQLRDRLTMQEALDLGSRGNSSRTRQQAGGVQ
jgi:uncharacterized protein (DUF2267 family)